MPRINFHEELDNLKDKVLAMAALTQLAVENSLEAYLKRDIGLCKYVKQNETAINTAQREIDEMAYVLLAKQQPMAIDLRFILAVIKITGDLERVGDQSLAITKRTKNLMKAGDLDLPVDFESMGRYAVKMIRSSVQSLIEGDARLAASVREMDDEIDRMYRVASEDLLRLIEQKPEMTAQAMNGIFIAKNLERIADHAGNVATDVIFWIRGADVRHELSLAG